MQGSPQVPDNHLACRLTTKFVTTDDVIMIDACHPRFPGLAGMQGVEEIMLHVTDSETKF